MAAEREPTGLFLRYCPGCNSAAPSVSGRGECADCGAALKIVDAGQLLEALGGKLDTAQRLDALRSCHEHDRPST